MAFRDTQAKFTVFLLLAATASCTLDKGMGTSETKSTASERCPSHPFMSPNGYGNMHNDSCMSDVYWGWSGPVSENFEKTLENVTEGGLSTRGRIAGQCPNQSFVRFQDGPSYDLRHYVLSMCVTEKSPKLILFDFDLNELARYDLPRRTSVSQGWLRPDLRKTLRDTSGVYFFLRQETPDALPKAYLAAADRSIRVVEIRDPEKNEGTALLREVQHVDLGAAIDAFAVPPDAEYPDNPITSVLPDHQGRLWFATRYGVVGYVRGMSEAMLDDGPVTFRLRTEDSPFEEVQNSFASADDGVVFISDHAVYLLNGDSIEARGGLISPAALGEDPWSWRTPYNRGSYRKPGSMNQGSGSTPSLFSFAGKRLVAYTDNADEHMHVIVATRDEARTEKRVLCKVPVFEKWRSSTENTLVVYKNSILVANNYGYGSEENPGISEREHDVEAGFSRIELQQHKDGTLSCRETWTVPVAGYVVPKLVASSELIYLYEASDVESMNQENGTYSWDLTALKLQTGERAFSFNILKNGEPGRLQFPGLGRKWNNNGSPISIAPDGERIFVGTYDGIAMFRAID